MTAKADCLQRSLGSALISNSEHYPELGQRLLADIRNGLYLH